MRLRYRPDEADMGESDLSGAPPGTSPTGDGRGGPGYVSECLPGRTLHQAWPAVDSNMRQAMIESLGFALRALHRVPVPADLLPPWLADALACKPWRAQGLDEIAHRGPRMLHGGRHIRAHTRDIVTSARIWARQLAQVRHGLTGHPGAVTDRREIPKR